MPKNNMNRKEILLSFIKRGSCVEFSCRGNGISGDALCPFNIGPGECMQVKGVSATDRVNKRVQMAIDLFLKEYDRDDLIEVLLWQEKKYYYIL